VKSGHTFVGFCNLFLAPHPIICMIKPGICGFCKSQKEIFEKIRLLEVQKTFYNPPLEKTVEKWRKRAPEDFEFTVKAWQVITHPASSPTYKKLTRALKNKENCGFFQPTKEVFDAFDTIVTISRLLKARIIVFQTPARFKPTGENIRNMEEFFSSVNREFVYVWESRGDWNPTVIKGICEELNLVDGCDPFKRAPVTEQLYFRLHGSPPGKHMYSYTYTDEDLKRLYSFCGDKTYVLFNNITMYENALQFQKLIKTL